MRPANRDQANEGIVDGDGEPPQKKARMSGAQRKKLAKEEQKKRKGANKGRRFLRQHDEVNLCRSFAARKECEAGDKCVFDISTCYLKMTQNDQDVNTVMISSYI